MPYIPIRYAFDFGDIALGASSSTRERVDDETRTVRRRGRTFDRPELASTLHALQIRLPVRIGDADDVEFVSVEEMGAQRMSVLHEAAADFADFEILAGDGRRSRRGSAMPATIGLAL